MDFERPYLVLHSVYVKGAYLKQALSEIKGEDVAQTTLISYGVLEKDIYLSHCIKSFAEKSPKTPIKIILKIALYAMLFMDKERSLVTNCAVELTKKVGKSGASGFVNAFLRNFDVEKVERTFGLNKLSVRYSYPVWAIKKIRDTYGEKRANSIMGAVSGGVSVRFERLDGYDLSGAIKTPFENNYIFKKFVRNEGYDRGDYTFQSIGSIAICDVVEGGKTLLDACAAPGGKSVLLAKKFLSVTSCEIHPHRASLIKDYAKRMGVQNIEVATCDSSEFNEKFARKFDAILCDAPCSGYGTVTENPDIKLFRKEEDVSALACVQKKLLNNLAKYGAKDIYYSTCSIFKEENDDVVEAFIQGGEYVPQEISSPLNHEKTKYGLQFLPDAAYGAGFYVCKLTRKP